MTAWNAKRYVSEAIESILQQQTERTWELVFVDDGSNDHTLAIVKGYAARLPGQMYVLQHPGGINRVISVSRNLALRHARGGLLAFLDWDDVWLSHHLETQAELLERMPQVAMVYASAERWVDFAQRFDEVEARSARWGRNYIPPLVPADESAGLLRRGSLVHWFRADESLVPCICTVMVRAGAARAVGGFCEDFAGLYDDQAFHAKIALRYDLFAHAVCVARYRQHEDSCCARSRDFPGEAVRERRRLEELLTGYLQPAASGAQ